MLQYNNLPDLLLAARDFFHEHINGRAFVSFCPTDHSWFFTSLDDPDELADYHADNCGTGVFFLTKIMLDSLSTNIDLDLLDSWLRTFPPSIRCINELASLGHVLLMHRGTLNDCG